MENENENIKDKRESVREKEEIPQNLEQVKEFFKTLTRPEEAEKFYDHFESNGWKVGGRAKMKSWKAAARNWCRNSFREIKSNVAIKIKQEPRQDCEGCQGTGKLEDGVKCWCF